MHKILSILIICTLLSVDNLSAQQTVGVSIPDTADYPYWIEMMQNPQNNFFTTVKAFNTYWKGREISRSSGYKPFKRWEYFWRDRIFPNGMRRPATEAFTAYFNFKARYSERDQSFGGYWTNIGPIQLPGNAGTGQPNGNGRVNTIAFHPTNDSIIYIGAPAGGLWKSDDGGQTWSSNTDTLPTLGVSSIVIDYTNPSIMFIGTGDRDAGDAEGMGVMKSTDGGLSWDFAKTGMGNVTVGKMIMFPSDHNMLLAATSSGIFKTTDGGQNWSQNKNGNFKDIVFKPGNSTVVYATSSGSFYRSSDGGDNWARITSGLGTAMRGVIGVSLATSDIVYFLTSQNSTYGGIYKSTDAGLNFTLMSNSPNILGYNCNGGGGGQGWYDLAIAVDPTNAAIVYVGGVNVFKSNNSGVSWAINSHWTGSCGVPAVHADCHALEFSPLDGRLYAGNDGGIYYSDDGGTSWNQITSGLAISQVYKIGQAATDKDKVMNGYQDNGSATFLGDSIGFLTVMGGDGMDCAYDFKNSSYAYGEYYNGAGISRIYNNYNQGGISSGISESGAWVTPIMLDENNPETMYVGMKNVWRSHNIRASDVQWNKISNNLGGSNNKNIRVLEQCAADSDIFYIARWDRKLFRTDNLNDDNPVFVEVSLPLQGTPTDIETNPNDANIVYITLNYNVYKSEDRGETWQNITGNLPSASKNTIEYYKNDNEGLYVGTDAGIYYKNANMSQWAEFSDGFPVSANVTEIEIYYDSLESDSDLVRASTYGRGLWSSPAWYGELTADFVASDTNLPSGCSIDFYDKSTGVPHQWQWTFEGANPSSSTEKNPTGIQYPDTGTFAVSLMVTNPLSTDTKIVNGYITVNNAILPNVNFYVADTVQCSGQPTQFFDQSSNCPTDWLWTFSPNTVSFSDSTDEHSQNPEVLFNASGFYSVTLSVSNNAGQSSLTKENYIFVGGNPLPYSENFENQSLEADGWTVENPQGSTTWELTSVTGKTGTTQAVWMNFFNYTIMNARDQLISPLLNFQGFSNVFMTFDYAYAQRYFQKDSLIVKISTDCGNSWTRIYANGPDGNGVFETSEPTLQFFEPSSAEDWCGVGFGAECPIIDLSNYAGQNNIKIIFESFNQYGNNLYIDNISISNTVGIFGQEANKDSFFSLYPNPSNGTMMLVLNNSGEPISAEVYDMEGRMLWKSIIRKKTNALQLKKLKHGMYYIRLHSKNENSIKKFIIQ